MTSDQTVMSTVIYILGTLGVILFSLLLVLSCLPSPTVRQLLQSFKRKGK